MKIYTTMEVCHALDDIKRERLREWVITQNFISTLSPSKGQGKASKFDLSDIYVLGVFKYLIDGLGIHRKVASEMVKGWPRPGYYPGKVLRVGFHKTSKKWMGINYRKLEDLGGVMASRVRYESLIVVNYEKITAAIDKKLPQ